MNIKVFNNYINTIMNAINSEKNGLDEETSKIFNQHGRWALHRLEKLMIDKDQNIRRWLTGKLCVFTSDKTDKRIEVNIGGDREALYYFLIFCKKLNTNQEIDESFRDYLSVVISRSCLAERWEEC